MASEHRGLYPKLIEDVTDVKSTGVNKTSVLANNNTIGFLVVIYDLANHASGNNLELNIKVRTNWTTDTFYNNVTLTGWEPNIVLTNHNYNRYATFLLLYTPFSKGTCWYYQMRIKEGVTEIASGGTPLDHFGNTGWQWVKQVILPTTLRKVYAYACGMDNTSPWLRFRGRWPTSENTPFTLPQTPFVVMVTQKPVRYDWCLH